MGRFSLLTSISILPGLLLMPQLAWSEDSNLGKLTLVANGEDFVRQGFVTKDGWQIQFDHAYVTINEVKAYQTEPPFNPDSSDTINPIEEVVLVSSPTTIDLAAGPPEAAPVVVTQVAAPSGQYNAIRWQVVKATEGTTPGQTIFLQGQATKEGEIINFSIGLNQPLVYECGEFVGEDRKGILQPGQEAAVEITFHFDHLFGDGETPANDPLNTEALGFNPLATLAQGNQLIIDEAGLEQQLSPEDYQTLQRAIAGLGHVGEGHCR